MTSMRPGPARQRFESQHHIRRGHMVQVAYRVGSEPLSAVVSTTGVYSRVTATGWLHLKFSEGPSTIRVDRITEVKEID